MSMSSCSQQMLLQGLIPSEDFDPHVEVLSDRVDFVGYTKGNNISMIFKNISFEDQGDYICFARNPKEKNRNHSAVLTLIVVDQRKFFFTSFPTCLWPGFSHACVWSKSRS